MAPRITFLVLLSAGHIVKVEVMLTEVLGGVQHTVLQVGYCGCLEGPPGGNKGGASLCLSS